MRKIYLLLIGLLLLIGCGAAEPEMVESFAIEDGDVNESQGAEQAARATPLPPRDKSTPLAISEVLTLTAAITPTEGISTIVRGEQTATVEQSRPNSSYCSAAAQHARSKRD